MIYDEKKTAIRMTAHYQDFEGQIEKWKDSFYMVWRYQMTWDFAYEIAVRDSRRYGVFIDILVKEAFKKDALKMLEDLGYRNVETSEENVGVVWEFEHPEFEDGLWTLVLEQ